MHKDSTVRLLPLLLASTLLAACSREPATVLQEAAEAMRTGNHEEAEEGFRWLLERTPGDAKLQANLAFALTQQGKHEEALPMYQALVAGGEGTYDLFAYYAKSLDGAGRVDDAIAWNYRALAIVPQLVDVRGDLAKLLVKHGRAFEALSLLASFDGQLEAQGRNAYFEGQRIAIASQLPPPTAADAAKPFKAVNIEGHYYTVAVGKDGETMPMLIDTGASHTVASADALELIGVTVPADAPWIAMQTADGREITGREFTLPTLQIGPHLLNDVKIVSCGKCASLLGQSTLERFDLMTGKVEGLDVLTMTLRPSAR
jgi:clan AA aspartic protease (TIGR02281 family)